MAKTLKTQNITISNNEKLDLIGNLSTMLSAGIPILESVDSLLEDVKGNQKKLLEALRADLMEGKHVYACFSKFPKVFDEVTVNLIKASEEAGTLDVTLKDLKGNIKKDMEFIDKIKSALTYPILILIVFLGVLLMILVVVVPKISTVFLRLRVDLPLPTQIMINTSNILMEYTLPIIILLVAGVIASSFLYKIKKKTFIHFLSSLPFGIQARTSYRPHPFLKKPFPYVKLRYTHHLCS
jgi:type II secretory pathway component PulF